MIRRRSPTASQRTAAAHEAARLLFVLPNLSVGGAQTQLATLLAARPELTRAFGVKIVTLSATRSPEMAARFHGLGITDEVVYRAGHSFPVFFWNLVRTIRRNRPVIVHTLLHGSTGTWGRLAARLAGVPVVFHSDLSLAPPDTRSQRLLRPLVDRLTTRFLPNAEAIADGLVAAGVPRGRIHVVPNGVDMSRFVPTVPSERRRWGIPAHASVAGFLGMLRPEKRPELLLDALLTLPPAKRPDHVVFAGDGPLMPLLRARREADPWLAEHCHLLGVVQDVPAFLAGIDYLVLPSEREGLPNVVLEAMAMEKPIVATRVSDVPRLVEGVGFLAEPGDTASLAGALEQMQALGPAGRLALGRQARERALSRYELGLAAERFWGAHLDFLGEPEAVR